MFGPESFQRAGSNLCENFLVFKFIITQIYIVTIRNKLKNMNLKKVNFVFLFLQEPLQYKVLVYTLLKSVVLDKNFQTKIFRQNFSDKIFQDNIFLGISKFSIYIIIFLLNQLNSNRYMEHVYLTNLKN
jgi:hypothetical protein